MIDPAISSHIKTGFKAGLFFAMLILSVVSIAFFGSGCVGNYDNASYIPHNRPADWEIRPYGDMRN